MNKPEKAMVEQLRTEAAFRWPTEAEPVPKPVPAYPDKMEGWDFNMYTSQVEREWSEGSRHGRFWDGKRMGGAQGGKRLYRTERDALVALRWALCRKMANDLRAVDRRIEVQGAPA